ncbi:MAG: alpha/beta hydrolase [Woeseiaceae bacterium]|nr:alpha/beta hydrolase [Woeseiaceae bacterium]
MQTPSAFYREAGSGPGVLCLHANASSSSQWRSLMDKLAPRFRVVAVDLYGAGKSPRRPDYLKARLLDEVQLIEPVLDRLHGDVILIGHSYGAAVALIAALNHRDRVRSLILYEPTMFSLVDAQSPPPNDADGIREAVKDALAALVSGNKAVAAKRFIDYWMGPGTFQGMPERNQEAIAASIVDVGAWRDALLGEPTPLRAFAELDIPVLYMKGKLSQPSSLAVARLLTAVLPNVAIVEFEKLGHMGPVTHPDVVNERIERYLADM